MNRRSFLIKTGSTITASTFPWQTYAIPEFPQLPTSGAGLSQQQWQILIAVQEHLFPAELAAPGAKDINAANYLLTVLTTPNPKLTEQKFFRDGIIQLEKIVQDMQFGLFITLSNTQREIVLHRLETTRNGKQWLRTLLEYILEALLSDPIYGGNPNEIGWRWLQHQAGFPRPPSNKKYYQLQSCCIKSRLPKY